MELKLVYRALRKISDWTVAGYYSETYIEGQENVPKDGPLIIASTHHNEIIDIAALAATVPHRRHLSFWAKSTMFANPVAGAILSSSGAIPVRRNPNNSSSPAGVGNPQDPSSSTSAGRPSDGTNSVLFNEDEQRAALFRDTSKALSANQVVGVFPEGTSYTQASIVQMLPGAAWAAVEFMKYSYMRGTSPTRASTPNGKMKEKEVESKETGLRIVPVAIVYTDKARYLSRIYIKYGDPIFADSYASELFSPDEHDASKAVVRKIMGQMEKQLREMTINAPDWDTICAVSMARSILWEDEDNISLKDWVEVSQRLVRIFDDPQESAQQLKAALTKYYALLHYADIKHSVLLSLLPLSSSSLLDVPPPNTVPAITTLVRPTLSLLSGLPVALIQLALFVPPLLFHLPGYLTGILSKKFLAVPGEEESPAQFKAVGGGLGIGANMALVLGVLWKRNKLGAVTALLGIDEDDKLLKRVVGLVGTAYLGVVVLVKWHKLLVKANYRQLQRLMTYHKLVSALAFTRKSITLSTAEVNVYSRPPLPAANVFIKKREAPSSDHDSANERVWDDDANMINTRRPPPARKLVRHLLQARGRACGALDSYLRVSQDNGLSGYLKSKGARISTL